MSLCLAFFYTTKYIEAILPLVGINNPCWLSPIYDLHFEKAINTVVLYYLIVSIEPKCTRARVP